MYRDIIDRIRKGTVTQFDVQELVKALATKRMTLGEETMLKGYIREGAEITEIHEQDLIDVYNSYSRNTATFIS